MAQTVDPPDSCPAMAISLQDLEVSELRGRILGTSSNGHELWEPTHKGEKIVLDLTPGEDDWLNIKFVDTSPLPHLHGESPQALCVMVSLSEECCEKLEAVDNKMMEVCQYSVMSGKIMDEAQHHERLCWKGIHCGGGDIIMNLVLEDSTLPTELKFIKNGRIVKGVGKAFLDSCLEGRSLKEFVCKPKVLLESVNETPEFITITVRVLSVILVPTVAPKMVAHTPDEDAAALRAAKRLRYAA